MTHFCLSYATDYGASFEDFVRSAAVRGYDSVQLIPDQTPNLYSDFEKQRTSDLAALIADSGLSCSLHNVFYDINLFSLVPAVQETAFEITAKCVDLSAALGARYMVLHTGYMFGGWRSDKTQAEKFWRNAAQVLERLSAVSRSSGVSILWENGSYFLTTATGAARSPLHIGIDPTELRSLCKQMNPHAGVSFDLNKALLSGHPIDQSIQSLRDLIVQVQISSIARERESRAAFIRPLSALWPSVEVVLEGRGDADMLRDEIKVLVDRTQPL